MTTDLRAQLQETLGDAYRIERELGGGGMSRVFLAEDVRLKRRVAIKVLSPDLAQGLSVERFEREIQTAAALQQANIVPVLSAGDTNGLPFYSMPFVEGESLRERLGRGPLSITEVIGVVRDVSKALAYAHRHGVVHRDIKPDNVLLSEGTAVVTDFGIAKAISAARTYSGAATLTQVGTSIGTPAYMAPEQAAGDPHIDHRADLYSLGAMAYELLSGRPVFPDRTPQRMLAAHMGETPQPIAVIRPDLPAPLADLVMQCLAKDANGRPQSAGDIVRLLETITSGGSMQAMPPILFGGPGIFRKALAIYAAAFVAVAILAKAAIVGIGLPDWVFPGALGVMALVLPVVLWTGYVQRVTRRAMTATPTYTPGGTPSVATAGTIATIALKAAPHVSWYRTVRGASYLIGAFVVAIAAFMGMRAFGVGPFGSLIASGRLSATDRIVMTDFRVSSGDSALGRVVSDAVRAGLNESRALTLMSQSEVAAALQRMQRSREAHVDLSLAQQIALREGAKAVVDGEVTPIAASFVVAVRLVTADSGKELASYRATAKSADGLISAADELSRKLRARAGESLRRIQNMEPLYQVTTSSLEALRLYSEATRANDRTREYVKSVKLLREAVAVDSNFAEAWRRLGVVMRNAGLPNAGADSATTRAYELRDRLSEFERNNVTAYYFGFGPGRDRAKSIATYEQMLRNGYAGSGYNNLALLLNRRREFARAESVARVGLERIPASQLIYQQLLIALQRQGRVDGYDSALADARSRFAGTSFAAEWAGGGAWLRGDLLAMRAQADSARRAPDTRNAGFGLGWAAAEAWRAGQIRRWRSFTAQRLTADSARGVARHPVDVALEYADALLNMGVASEHELPRIEDALKQHPMLSRPEVDRPYFWLAIVYAKSGNPDRARRVIAQYRSEVKDTSLMRDWEPWLHEAQAYVARAEGKFMDAVREFRLSDRLPDGPVNLDQVRVPLNVILAFADANMPDSAIAEYERYRQTPFGQRPLVGPDLAIGPLAIEAIAKMYDVKGNTDKAVQHYRWFVQLYEHADPEIQPRVAHARQRLEKLTPVEKTKR